MRCRTTGKVMHRTRDAALFVKRKVGREKNIVLHAYRCQACKCWHLGNTPNTQLENMNRLFDRIAANRP